MKTQNASLIRIVAINMVIMSVFWPILAKADGVTNRTFRSILRGNDLSGSAQDIRDLMEQNLSGKFGHELLPASEDPQGDWGQVTNGLQMSIRFYQNNWTNGQAVSAVILWRNVSATNQTFGYLYGVQNYYFDLVVRFDGTVLKPLVSPIDPSYRPDTVSGPGPIILQPGEQIRIEQRIDGNFVLNKPGVYEVSAERRGLALASQNSGFIKGTKRPWPLDGKSCAGTVKWNSYKPIKAREVP